MLREARGAIDQGRLDDAEKILSRVENAHVSFSVFHVGPTPASVRRDRPNRAMVWLLGRGDKRSELAFIAERESGPPPLTPRPAAGCGENLLRPKPIAAPRAPFLT